MSVILLILVGFICWKLLPEAEKKKVFEDEKEEVLREGYFEK